MGFRVGIMGDKDVCIIDFLDNPDKNIWKAFSSVTLTKDNAKDLIKELNIFIDEE